MPGVEVEEGHEEVDADGGTRGDDEIGEDVVAEVEALGVVSELPDDDVDAGEGVVSHDYCVDYHGGEVESLGALGPVAHGEDELCADKEDAHVAEDGEDIETDVVTKGVDCGV